MGSSEWADLKVPALRGKCTELGIQSTGLRAELVARLQAHERDRTARLMDHAAHQRMYDPRNNAERPIKQAKPRVPFSPLVDRVPEPRDAFYESPPLQQRPGNGYQNNNKIPQQDYSRMSEAELERLCRENWQPYAEDQNGFERRKKIRDEYDLKYEAAKTKKDAAIHRAMKKFNTEVENLRVEKEDALSTLEESVSVRMVKGRVWGPAFGELRRLREARGLKTFSRDFEPPREYAQLTPSMPHRLSTSPPRAPGGKIAILKRKPESLLSITKLNSNNKRVCLDTSYGRNPINTSYPNPPPPLSP